MGISERVSRAVDEAVSEEQIVGAVVLVYQDGEPLLCKAAGYADREAQIPVSLDTIFRYASVTKPIVAATALAMIEAGLFRTDDAVSDILPWFRPRTPDGREPRITVHHLLTHTSGLVYDPALEVLPVGRAVSLGLSNTDLTLEENFSRCNAVPLAFEPGSRWAYSHATDILGALIATVHGGSLETAVIRYVTGPLRMDDARFHVIDPKRLSIAYADGTERPARMPDPWVPAEGAEWRAPFSPARIFNPKAFQSGGAGMAGTAGDILKLLEVFRQGGSPIVSPETAAAALSNQIGDVAGDPGMRYGYLGGIITDPALAGTCLPAGAIRWGGVYGGTWFIDPARKLTVVNLTNTALEGCMGLYPERIRRAVYAEG